MNTLKTKSNDDKNFSKLAVNKSLLKEYKTSDCTRTVYLNDGDEFQIQLFNPETTEIGAEIFIDGEPLSNIIILNPGERMWLERYTDKAKKFKFKVYTVDGESKAVEKAIAHNGEIEIKFYRKQKPVVINRYHYPDYVYRDITVEPWKPNIWYNYNITCSDANSVNTVDSGITTCSANLDLNSVNYCSCELGAATGMYDASAVTASASAASARTLEFTPEKASFSCGETHYEDGSSSSWAAYDGDADPNLIETGRVAEGSHSNQKFQNVDIDLEIFAFRTENFKILPYSRKPYTANDAKKIYCSNCGHKLNTKFKYCPYCGAEID